MIDKKIVGSVRTYKENETCYIDKLIVHPEYQSQGIGSIMMQEIENMFHLKRYELFTGEKSKKNLYLYQKLGYKIFKKEKLSDKVKIVYLEKINE